MFQVFYNPLADSGMLTEQELSTVFINWKELIWCNMRLLKYVTCNTSLNKLRCDSLYNRDISYEDVNFMYLFTPRVSFSGRF